MYIYVHTYVFQENQQVPCDDQRCAKTLEATNRLQEEDKATTGSHTNNHVRKYIVVTVYINASCVHMCMQLFFNFYPIATVTYVHTYVLA